MPFSREQRKVRRRRSETACTVVILKEASNIPSIPVVGLGPHGQLAEVGSGVVDDGLVHVVPEAETLGLGTSLDLLGGVKGPVAGALNAVARQRDVISYVTGRERGNIQWERGARWWNRECNGRIRKISVSFSEMFHFHGVSWEAPDTERRVILDLLSG